VSFESIEDLLSN